MKILKYTQEDQIIIYRILDIFLTREPSIMSEASSFSKYSIKNKYLGCFLYIVSYHIKQLKKKS